MNAIPEEIQTCIIDKLKDHHSILSLRETSCIQKKIVDYVLRKEYEEELCKLFESLRISIKKNDGSCRIKDILTKNFCYSSLVSTTKCYTCKRDIQGILSCECHKTRIKNPWKKILLGPVMSIILCGTVYIIKKKC